MSRRTAINFIYKFNYFLCMFFGILPSVMDWQKLEFRKSNLYLAYSALIHSLMIANIPLMRNYYLYDTYYTSGNAVLNFCSHAKNIVTLTAALLMFQEVWLKRIACITAFQNYCDIQQRYKSLLTANGSNKDERLLQIRQHIEALIIWKFFCGTSLILLMAIFAWYIDHKRHGEYSMIILVNAILSVFLFLATNELFGATCALYRQFLYNNVALSDLRLKLMQLSEHGANVGTELPALTQQLSALAVIHFDSYCLALKIFRIFAFTCATMMLKIFITSIGIMYHAVKFQTYGMPVSNVENMLSFFLTFSYYGNTLVVLFVADKVQATCNEAGSLLRECFMLLKFQDNQELTRALEVFSDHLRCHKLTYKVCGLYILNRQFAMHFFFTIIVNVTVLIQFDLKNGVL